MDNMNKIKLMNPEFITILPGDMSMDKEITFLVTSLITNLKLAEEKGENPKRFASPDYFMGKIFGGRFCDVWKCFDRTIKKEVAVKIFKDTCKKEDIEREVSIVEEIALGDPFSKFNVKLLKQCEHDGRTCLVFEPLQCALLKMDPTLNRMRLVAIQLLLALDELKALNIIHADIHPGNIMYVNTIKQPYYIKLIDFGMAIKASDAQPGMDLQTLEYRAPEIFLGLPFTEAIDVWGVGCVLAFLYLGHNLFSGSSEDQVVERIVELLGQPEDHLLRSGKYTQRYFMEDEGADGPTWRLRNPGKQNDSTDQLSCLEDLLEIHPCIDSKTYHEHEDMVAFVDLLKQLLQIDANQRISARQALKHPFFTMDHLINHFEPEDNYLNTAKAELKDCSTLSEYLEDKSANWTPFQEFPVVSTHWDQEGRVILYGSSSSYTVLEKLGHGVYSIVLRCQNRTTKEEVAVKIPRMNKTHEECTGAELAIYEEFSGRNPDSKYFINLLDRCKYHGQPGLIFEMLDTNLIEDVFARGKMTLRSIRPIAKQVLLALDELKALNIQHNDLHAGNIMYVNRQDQPHRVKVIDFGLAKVNEEVDNKPIDELTDMAAFGLMLVSLYVGHCDEYGFDVEKKLGLKKSEESEHSQVQVNSTDNDAEPEDPLAYEEREDRIVFADLLKQTLHVDRNQRISPRQALQHPFITMEHLINRFETSHYLDASQAIMNECPVFSADTVKSSSGCPPDQKSSGSPDGVPVTSSEGVKPTDFTPDVSACPSDGELPPISDQDKSEVGLSGGARSSEGAKPTDFTPDVSASSGGLRKLLQRIHRFFRRVKNSDRKIPTVPDENHPDVCPSDGEIPPVPDQDNSEVCLSGGGLPQCFNDEELLTARSSEGAKPTDFTPDVSASSGGLRKLLKRISRVKNYLCSCLHPDVED